MGCLGDPGEDCCPSRWVFAFMGFMSISFAYILRVDMNLALVGMVNHTALETLAYERWLLDGNNGTPADAAADAKKNPIGTVCPIYDDGFPATVGPTLPPSVLVTTPQPAEIILNSTELTFLKAGGLAKLMAAARRIDGPFVWEETAQTVVISSFFGGYLWTQLFGGRIAEHFGGKDVVSFSLISAAILHFLVPVAASTHFYLLVLQRFLSGLCLGFSVPTLNVMISKWCPPGERSRMNAAVHSGQLYGTVFALPLTGAILGSFGWQAVFYIIGSLAVMHFVAWVLIVHESPGLHPSISRAELSNIEGAIGNQRLKNKLPLPWKSLLKSGPFWAIVIGVFGNSCGFSIMLALLPTYLSEILHLGVEENGLVSAIPFLAQALTAVPVSILIDLIRRKGLASVTTLRKVSHSIGQIGAGIMIVLLPYVGCDRSAVMYVLAITGVVQSFNLSGFSANMLDIAPNFSGTITGIVHIGYNIVSILAPITAGIILDGRQTLERWSLIFYASAVCYWVGAAAFMLLASGEEQSWNQPHPVAQFTGGHGGQGMPNGCGIEPPVDEYDVISSLSGSGKSVKTRSSTKRAEEQNLSHDSGADTNFYGSTAQLLHNSHGHVY